MPVPIAAVDEDRGVEAFQDDVGAAGHAAGSDSRQRAAAGARTLPEMCFAHGLAPLMRCAGRV